MGCTTSSLAGPNDFKDIDATPSHPVPWRTTHSAPDPVESPLSAEAYTHTMPTMTRSDRGAADYALQSAPERRGHGRDTPRFGSHAYMGSLPFTGKGNSQSPEVKGMPAGEPEALVKNDSHVRRAKDGGYGSDSHSKPTEPNVVGQVAAGKERVKIGEWEAEQMEKARMKAERAKEGQYGNLGKMAGLGRGGEMDEESLAQGLWKKWKKGGSERRPVEEYDPVTGIGKRTGMTKEEIIDYVGRTRGAGLYSGRKYAFVSTGESGLIY